MFRGPLKTGFGDSPGYSLLPPQTPGEKASEGSICKDVNPLRQRDERSQRTERREGPTWQNGGGLTGTCIWESSEKGLMFCNF